MIKSLPKEIASSSNVNAPIFTFKSYVRGETYENNGSNIDFVTDDGNLYVPVSDNTVAEKNPGHAREDSGFMLLVSKGEQGEQGVKGEKGNDGKTPSVYARFDGKQMVFYTMEDIDGESVIRRIAATNDLTGPAWKPELVNDTIVWKKTKDDEAPRSIPLNELRADAKPVLLRTNSDNTSRQGLETGPANYIQWKYEGQDYWNNLISISELMNLTLAGVTIFPVLNEETNIVEYHLGHKEVTKATYDSTPEGKRIITDVELGEVLFDAGKIPFPEYNYDLDIEWLKDQNCERKNEIKAIQLELPKFVKSVNGILPDSETGNVEVPIPDAYTKVESDNKYQPKGDYALASDIPSLDGYLKASDLKFRVVVDPNDEHRYLEVSMDGGNNYTRVMDATCACDHGEPVEPCVISDVRIVEAGLRDASAVSQVDLQEDDCKTYRCEYTLTGDCVEPNITWSIGDSTIATAETRMYQGVPEVVVCGIAPGNTTLNVLVDNIEVSVPVNVTAAVDPCTVTSVAITDLEGTPLNRIDLIQGGDSKSIKAVYETAGECETIPAVDWTMGDYSIAMLYPYTTGSSDEFQEDIWGDAVGETTLSVTVGGVTSNSIPVSVTAPAPIYYTLYIDNENEANVGSIEINGEPFNNSMQIEEGTSITSISATKENHHIASYEDNDTHAQITLPFNMIKDTHVLINWEENTPDYTAVSSVSITGKPSNNKITWDCSDGQIYNDLEATVSPNNATYPTVSWSSSNTSVATIDASTGKLTIKGVGTTTITATADNIPDSFTLTVERPAISSFSLNKSETTLEVGETETLSVNSNSISPTCAEIGTLTWTSSDTSIATVNTSGKVTAKADGETTITAKTSNNKTATCVVTVEDSTPGEIEVSDVTIGNKPSGNKIIWDCSNNQTHTLSATVLPNDATDKTITWSSSHTSIATIGQTTGVITVKSPGTTTITASGANNQSDSFLLTIERPAVTDISLGNLSGSTLTLEVDGVQDVSNRVSLTPSCATGTVTWTSGNTSIATVSSGFVTGKSEGTTTITASINGHSDSFQVHVIQPCYLTVSNQTNGSISAGLSGETAKTIAKGGNWQFEVSRSDHDLFEIDGGTANAIWVYYYVDGDIEWIEQGGSDSCSFYTDDTNLFDDYYQTIYVVDTDPSAGGEIAVQSVIMDCHDGPITVGDSITLSATVYPSDATDKTITWVQGQNPKGTIEGNTFTATSDGIALIHAEAGGVSSNECGITIDRLPVHVEGISINTCPGTIAQGLTNVYLTATIYPSDADNKNVTWSSSNSNIIAVEQTNDGRGHLIVKNTAGTARITVTTEDGNYSAYCDIEVPSSALEFGLINQTEQGNKIYYTIGDDIDENEWNETWSSLNYGANTGTTPPLTIQPGESLCITSENYAEDIQLEIGNTNKDDVNGFITLTYDELYYEASGTSEHFYPITFVRQH